MTTLSTNKRLEQIKDHISGKSLLSFLFTTLVPIVHCPKDAFLVHPHVALLYISDRLVLSFSLSVDHC